MKNFKKPFVSILLLSSFALAGCSVISNLINSSDGDGSDGSDGGALPYSREQAQNKLRELGETSGFEMVFHTVDDEEETSEDATYGMKGNLTWIYEGDEKSVLKFENDVLYGYSYSYEEEAYVLDEAIEEDASETYDMIVGGLTSIFFIANYYETAGYSVHKVKDVTYIGRSAEEYRLDMAVALAGEVHMTMIVDKQIGITLYWDATGTSYEEGETASASFSVTSFKTGNQVVAPVLPE